MNLFEPPSFFNEADSYTYASIKPVLRVESINLEDSLNRVLAEDITAVRGIPPFSRAVMDGYAVIARDTIGTSQDAPKIFEIVDYLYAGGVSKKYLSSGECVQITTGAKVPEGADAVVMTENTGIENGRLCIYKPVSYGDNIETEGQDVKRGRVLLRQGTFLTPAGVGLIATQGIQKIKVYEKPKVAVISNGEELTEAGDILKDGQIYDVNSFTVSAIVSENGCLPLKFGIVGDNPEKIRSIIDEALKVADFVFISGGSSRGDRDYLMEILQKLGRIPSYKIKSNGKSGIFVIASGKPVLGTPGFPSSCLINAYVLLVPALRKIAQLPCDRRMNVTARLTEKVESDKNISGRFLPLKIEGGRAIPVISENKGIVNLAKADGYIILDEETATIEEGCAVSVNLF
jgi:molybdenum cofactor synthesis domain-containing protein